MKDNKMSDAEIIKALECCKNLNCYECPKQGNIFAEECDVELCEEAVDLINRKDAEIERLKEERDAMHKDVITAEKYAWNLRTKLKTTKSEAYKEFAEMLYKDRVSNDPVVIAVKVELKELTRKVGMKNDY